MKTLRIVLMSLIGCTLSAGIYAGNYNFLNDSAISYFTQTDTDMMSANMQHALNRTPDGKKSSWKNPQTTAWGYAIPSQTRRQNGTTCRQLKIFNEAKKRTGVSNYLFCKIKGEWKIV